MSVRAEARTLFRAFPDAPGPADVVVLDRDAALLSGAVTRAVVERTRLLTVHATVVHAPAGALVFPAPSGLGKSTLAVALGRAGFELMSDELAAFDDRGQVLAFPRPVTLDGDPAGATARERDRVGEVAIDFAAVGRLGPARSPVAAVIVPSRAGSGPASLLDSSPGEAAGALIRHAFNHFRRPAEALRIIAGVVAGSESVALTYSEATDAAVVLAGRYAPSP